MRTRLIPILVNGGLDTKTNPKLLKPGAALQLDNMFQARTGEFRARYGATKLLAQRVIGSADNLFVTAAGGLGSVARNHLGLSAWPLAVRYGNVGAGIAGWETNYPGPMPAAPMVTCAVTSIPALNGAGSGGAQTDVFDPDLCLNSGYRTVIWSDNSANVGVGDMRELASGKTSVAFPGTAIMTPGRVPKVAASAGAWQVNVVSTGLTLAVRASTLGFWTTSLTLATDLDSASPWFDVKNIPGTTTFAVAYKVTGGGGVKCGVYDPAANAFTAVIATAGADASFTLGWLDDSFTTGSMYLATAGSTSGVVLRVMSATTMVVSTTRTIDAAATANVRNVTGHLTAATPTYRVAYDVAGASAFLDRIKMGTWDGTAVTLGEIAPNHSIYSRSVKFADGTYYLLGFLSSAVQPLYSLISLDSYLGAASGAQAASCVVLSGTGGARRAQCSIASPAINGSQVLIAATKASKTTTPVGTATQSKTFALLSFTQMTKITHARELGGSVFLPGGMVQRDDRTAIETATFPIYPETPTAVTSAGGSMTASGTYLYRLVLRRTDAAGRIARSAGCVPLSVPLGVSDGTATLTIPNVRFPATAAVFNTNMAIAGTWFEVYREGPAASGATLYNKVGELVAGQAGADTLTFVDTMSDVNAAFGEAAYFNGGVLENFNPPATSVLEVNDNRVGLISAEDPTQFCVSKEYKSGVGIGFNPQFNLSITGDGAGPLTALAAMDGKWVLFKKTAIYIVTGTGQNDLGQGGYNPPQAVTRNVGTVNPSSVIETPNGILFQASTGGIWLLGRDLGVTYVGAPIEAYALAESVVGVAAHPTLTTVRMVFPSGRMIEWDYFQAKWYAHRLRVDRSGTASTVVDCANSPLFGWCYVLANGDLMSEVAASVLDVNGTSTPIIPVISLPHLDFAGLAGYQRLYSLDVVIDVLGKFTLSMDAEFNYSGSLTGAPTVISLSPSTPTFTAQYLPPDGFGKNASARPVITVLGKPAGATFRITSVTARIGIKPGSNAPASSRLT